MASEMLDLAHTALIPAPSSPNTPPSLILALAHATVLKDSISPKTPLATRLLSLSHLLQQLASPSNKLHPLNVHYAHTLVTELLKILESNLTSPESREHTLSLVKSAFETLSSSALPDIPDGTGWNRELARRLSAVAQARLGDFQVAGVEEREAKSAGGEELESGHTSAGSEDGGERRDGGVGRVEGGSELTETEMGEGKAGVDQRLADGQGRRNGVQEGGIEGTVEVALGADGVRTATKAFHD